MTWDERAICNNLEVNTVITAGAVLHMDAGVRNPRYNTSLTSTSGHVAFIDAVEGGIVYISEANCSDGTTVRYSRTLESLQAIIAGSYGGVEVIHVPHNGFGPASYVKTPDDKIWVVAGGAKYQIPTWADYVALGSPPYTSVSQSHVDSLGTVPADGTMLRDVPSNSIYQVIGGAKYKIPNWSTYQALGTPDWVNVPWGWLVQMSDGAPEGVAYMHDHQSGKIYQVINGAKYEFSNWAEYQLIDAPPWVSTTSEFINRAAEQFPTGTTYLRNPTTSVIYEVVAGTKRQLTFAEWTALSGATYVNVSPQWLAQFATAAEPEPEPEPEPLPVAPTIAGSEVFVLGTDGTLVSQSQTGAAQVLLAGVADFDVSGAKALLLTGDGELLVTPAQASSAWHDVGWTGGSIADVKIDGTRLVVLEQSGAVWAREGLYSGSWTQVATGANAIDADAGRLAYGTSTKNLYVAQGAVGTPFMHLHTATETFSIAGDRVAVQSGSALYIKSGALDGAWTTVHASVSSFAISDSRILVRSGPALYAKEGPVSAAWVTIYTSAATMDVSQGVIPIVGTDGVVRIKWGVLNAPWSDGPNGVIARIDTSH